MAEQKTTRARRPKTTATQKELTTKVATPAIVQPLETPTGSVRRAIDASVPNMSTPLATLARMKRARAGDARAAVEIIEPLLYQDLNYSSAVDTVIEALTSAMLISEPAGELARDKRLSMEVQKALLDSDAVMGIVEHLATVDDFGYALAEVIWNTSGARWTIEDVVPINPAWVTFDKNDARTPLLLPDVPNALPSQLTWGKFIYADLPGYGLPYLRSHGYAAALYKALADMSTKDWAAFLEMFGQPMRKGTFDPEAFADRDELEKVKKVLRKALENLASDAWAMLPKGVDIELLEAATKGTSSDLYERFVRYTNELITKRKTGSVLATGTGNTGSGGTMALGSVHNEALLRKVRSLGRRVAAAIRRCVVEPYVRFNYGPDVPVPFVKFSFEEQEDLGALSQALGVLVPLGLEVSQEEVRDRLGLRAPADGESILRITTKPAEPADADASKKEKTAEKDGQEDMEDADDKAELSAQALAALEADEIDALVAEYQADPEYQAADKALDAQVLSAIDGAETAEQLVAALLAVIKGGDVDAMRAVLTAALTSTRAAGDFGANIGGK